MEALREIMKTEQGFEAEGNTRLNDLRRTVATTVVSSLTDHLLATYQDLPDVLAYLHEVRRDMIDHIEDFLPQPPVPNMPLPVPRAGVISPLRRYEVNLLVDCTNEECAIVVYESNPTPQRLFGRIEKEAFFGAVTTDFSMIRPGSMHRANGGYLV